MKKHILLIDDEADIRDMLGQVLTLKGYRVATAATGAAALRLAKEDPPHLVLCDLQMPDTDGLVLIDQLKQILPQVPILLLTGVVFDTEVVEANVGKRFDAYLSKTASLQRLIQEVRRLLGEDKPG
jgi:two-component system OmpR family response regulator